MSTPPENWIGSQFESEVAVRPDDIDQNQHVHNSRYFDYVLAARYDQMARCYGMAMDEFIRLGFGWVVKIAHLEYKRPLNLGDTALVRTRVTAIAKSDVTVHFEIRRKESGKLACDGWFQYTMVSLETGRGTVIPEWIAEKYSV
jgi:acyl-CoA thioester hydrolase/thioesterase-3